MIAPAADSVLITSGSNVPSLSQTLPANVQVNITKLGVQSQALNMGSHFINNVLDPSLPQDAATKSYVDSAGGAFLPLAGGVMSGVIDMNSHKIINLTTPTAAGDAVNKTYLDTNFLPLAGGTMAVNTGVINMNNSKIVGLATPTNGGDAANKAYVDLFAAGITVKAACAVATTANLNAIYLNGASGIGATLTNAGALTALVIDGYTVQTNDRVLVKNQTTTLENGVYVATNVGSGAVAWILTRATDFDQPSEIQPGDLVIINNGTANAGTSWIETATVTAVGTDPILFSQFTFSASAVLLKANNLSDVASKTISFNNISPLTTKGDLIGFDSTDNVRLAVGGTNGQILQVLSSAATGLAWSTASYPTSTTVNQILYSSSSNVVAGISTTTGGVLVTDASSIPQFLANPSASGKILQSVSGAISAWSTPTYPSLSGTARKILVSDGTNNIYSTETWAVPGTSGNVLTSDGTNWTSAANPASTLLTTKGDLFGFSTVNARVPVATGNGKILQVDSTAAVGLSYSTPTYPSASGTSGKFLISDGTNNVYSTPTIPNTAGTSGKVLISDGTNFVSSTPTFPNASATTRKIIVSDGTNWIASTETYAVPGTSGNVMTSDGTNWTSASSSASVPTGAMFNFQQAQLTTVVTTTSSTFSTATGLSVTITPTSSSNKVLVRAVVQIGVSIAANEGYFRLFDGSVAIGVGTSVGSRTAVGAACAPGSAAIGATIVMEWLDSPATTSAKTYSVQFASNVNGQLVAINSSATDTNSATFPRMASTISACEIKV